MKICAASMRQTRTTCSDVICSSPYKIAGQRLSGVELLILRKAFGSSAKPRHP